LSSRIKMSTSSCIMCNKKNPNCSYGQFQQIIFYFHLKRWQFYGRRNYSWEGDDTNMKYNRIVGQHHIIHDCQQELTHISLLVRISYVMYNHASHIWTKMKFCHLFVDMKNGEKEFHPISRSMVCIKWLKIWTL
jgi:hypothetical protein